MKKEKIIQKILLKSLIGLPIGITLLIFSYLSTYFIVGNDIFNNELYQLHNINIFIFQIISAGISGYMLCLGLSIFSILSKIEKNLNEHPYKSVFIIILSFLCILLIMPLLTNKNIFSQNISNLNLIILIIVYAICGSIFCIRNSVEKYYIKKINKKLKERNN